MICVGKAPKIVFAIAAALAVVGSAFAWQMPWREYPGQDNIEIPPDFKVQAEWVFARLMYPPYYAGFRGGGDWRQGRSSWTTDYTAADRHMSMALRRLTRVSVRSVEQPVNLDDGDDVYNWPWLYAVEVGRWKLTDSQVKQLRDFVNRGGFFMVDDFHGGAEWSIFMESMQKVFPDRPVVDIPNEDSIFHTIFDLNDRYQVPGAQYLRSGRTWERTDGVQPHWRGIYDEKGRLVVVMCHNMDLGDAWEWADYPQYDEKFSGLAFRIASNYVVYSMTH